MSFSPHGKRKDGASDLLASSRRHPHPRARTFASPLSETEEGRRRFAYSHSREVCSIRRPVSERKLMKKFLCLALTLFFTTSAFPSHAAGSVWNPEDGVVLSGVQNSKKIALTFDDGPPSIQNKQNSRSAERIQHPCDVFCHRTERCRLSGCRPARDEEGHEIGNHTYHHKSLYRCKKETVEEEIISTEEILIDKTGCVPRVFRPPEGAYTCDILDVAGRMNYDVIL